MNILFSHQLLAPWDRRFEGSSSGLGASVCGVLAVCVSLLLILDGSGEAVSLCLFVLLVLL